MPCVKALCVLVGVWLGDHGYDASHRDAVLVYIERESGFDPDVVSRNGVCLYQWAGQRRRAILARGACPDWRTQVEFADVELHGPFAGFWRSPDPARHMREHFGRGVLDR